MEEKKDKPCCPEATPGQSGPAGSQTCCCGPGDPANKTISLVKKGLFVLIILAALAVAVHAVFNKGADRPCPPGCTEKALDINK